MTNRKELLREFLLMNLGTLLVSVGVYFFKFPNHFSMGGVSGLAVLLGKLLPQLSPSTFNTIINVLFLVLGFVMLNRGFGARTVYCSILSAGLIQLFEWRFPGPPSHRPTHAGAVLRGDPPRPGLRHPFQHRRLLRAAPISPP